MARLATQSEILAVAEAGLPEAITSEELVTVGLKVLLADQRLHRERLQAGEIVWIEWTTDPI